MNTNDFVIERVTTFSPEILEAIRNLVKQIGNNYQPLTDEELRELLDSSQSFLFIARHNSTQTIAGMIMAMIYRIPYTKKAYIDDLIVDENFRKMGIATMLMHQAIETAKKHQAAYIDFTSRPQRAAGNNLYEKLGFQKRDTNVYRLSLHYEEV
ncbi:MAG TPA: GNAT family N-acetyltransferase [Candidatus Sulfotelmatobacter sp.]|jgi:ribosomal protein S18 acetylase RimI-like enzyme|nr:GNAT family N-acetyltransferase [Candidatus Sulfotelmatobacter sp.]